MMMHDEENGPEVLSLIKRLMEELQGNMEYSKDDFEERLGRKKPEVDVTVLKGEMPKRPMMMEEAAPEMGGDSMEDDDEDMEDEDDDAGMLKKRLMRLRS